MIFDINFKNNFSLCGSKIGIEIEISTHKTQSSIIDKFKFLPSQRGNYAVERKWN